ncbi:MAG: bifunctional phosphoribosyl-AMP cyclohydrolase/phosphoribosyl-ATP diphosphatase HisIE [Woeseiaceae bacterium]|nr:bifunctional phosphoribosyl-AMP cyclohydrolase/phosphoribosyl-ATP diphosphatase HisIE [Woeseiaceae bacterium]
MNSLAERIDWDKCDGLLPAIVQDATSGRVLMLGYMNVEALARTLESKRVTFYSRSRQRLWVKGETSGNTLEVLHAELDCDGDTILVHASAAGPTCHLEKTSCFDADAMTPGLGFIGHLESIIDQRMQSACESSYTARLNREGTRRIAQKIGEEGVELALAATEDDPERITAEAADLVYHLLVLLRRRGLSITDVASTLQSRHRP